MPRGLVDASLPGDASFGERNGFRAKGESLKASVDWLIHTLANQSFSK